MDTGKILETERLLLRKFNAKDARFILTLLNTPSWLRFIGDKNVKTIEDAIDYLKKGPMDSYKKNGFGLSMVVLKDSSEPIGTCGLIKRDVLKDVDIGFAFLPEYSKKGYAYEIASATMSYARNSLKIDPVVAITDADNISSIKLLDKIGLRFEKTIPFSNNHDVLLFSPENKGNNKVQIDDLTRRFFSIFNTKNRVEPNVKDLHQMVTSQVIFTNTTNGSAETEALDSFVRSREKILTDSTLTNFNEKELFGKTEIFGNIAQRFALYEKSGEMDGKPFESRGMKTIQFIKINGEWKISAVAWHDV